METYKFKAEINQLLDLIINAFYSNKDIFLRELISNSSDALDKLKYLCFNSNQGLGDQKELVIKILPNLQDNTVTILDTGIGMTKEELKENLGTIAKSGTKSFIQQLKETKDINMIGQFGVGFYSLFLVGDSVEVITKHPNSDKTYLWSSTADGTYSITEYNDSDIDHGTKIIIHLKNKDYLEESKLREIILKYSNFINYPIMLWSKKTREVEQATEIINEKEEIKVEESNKQIEETYYEYEQVNKQQQLWTKNPQNITTDEYQAFYRDLINDEKKEYFDVIHFKTEGQLEFISLFYIPKRAPYDMFQTNKKINNVKLYVKRVFITDECDDLLPEYLCFLKGLVDSNDLPLNVSREILQQNVIMGKMKKHIVKKVLDVLIKLNEDSDKYDKFYEHFGRNIKLGVYQDDINKNKLSKLLRFYTLNHKDNRTAKVSLDQYVSNMKEDQKDIYYITGQSLDNLEESPFIDTFKTKEFDVLLLIEPIDEYVVKK